MECARDDEIGFRNGGASDGPGTDCGGDVESPRIF